MDSSDIAVTVLPSVPIIVRAEACLPDAATNDAAVAALRKAYASPESAMALLEANGLHVILTEPPAVHAFMRGPAGEEIFADGVSADKTAPVPMEALTAALLRHTTDATETAEEAVKAEAEKAAKAAELASVAAASAATLEAAKAELAEAEAKAEAAQAAAKEAEAAETAAQAAESQLAREATKAQLEGLFGDGSLPAPSRAQSAPPQPSYVAMDPIAEYRAGKIPLDTLPTLDRIAVLEADGADEATLEEARAQLRTEMGKWTQDAEALRLARAEEAKAALATRDPTIGDTKELEDYFAEKVTLREEAERTFYTGAFEQARLERIERARRAKIAAIEMQQAMAKAKAEAEAKEAEEEAARAAEAEAERNANDEVLSTTAYRDLAAKALADAARATANAEEAEAKLAADLSALIAADEAAREAAAQAKAAASAAEAALRELERELSAPS